MNRKRPRKGILNVSKRHLNRLVARESDIIYDSLLNTTAALHNNNYDHSKCLNNNKITSRITDKCNVACIATENGTTYETENDISIRYKNDEYLQLNKSDSEQSSGSISHQSILNVSKNVNAITDNNFQNGVAEWATEHQISHTALRALLQILRQHSLNCAIARQKLKQVEQLSELSSDTEKEEYLKKSRKIRAAKTFETSMSSSEESDESIYISEVPKIPRNSNMILSQRLKKPAQKDNCRNNATNKEYPKKVNVTTYSHCTEKTGKKDSQLQKNKNVIVVFDNELYPMTVYDYDDNLQDPLYIANSPHVELYQNKENNDNDNFSINSISSPNLAFNKDPQCSKNLSNTKQLHDSLLKDNSSDTTRRMEQPVSNLNYEHNLQCDKNLSNAKQSRDFSIEDNSNLCTNDVTERMEQPKSNLNSKQKSENFQQFVVRKLLSIESKINLIHAKQELILDKLSTRTLETEDRETLDIFQDLPLKDNQDLMDMEVKLKNDLSYRNQMIKQLRRVTCQNMKTSCLRLMRVIFSNELAMNYSWFGAKKKEIFSKLEICKIIMSVIRKSHPDVTDEQISAPIKIWLAHAKERQEKRHRNTQE